jgi:CBS-domain-containing membrane protein
MYRQHSVPRRLTVKDVMTAQVRSVSPSTTFKEMSTILDQYSVSALPVLDDSGAVVGIVSEADLILKQELHGSPDHRTWLPTPSERRERAKAGGLVAADVMTTPVVTIQPGAPLSEAARVMHHRALKRIPVVDDKGVLVGVVSRADLLKAYEKPDTTIRDEVLKGVMLEWMWIDPAQTTVEVTVQDGVVTLTGEIQTRSDMSVLARLIEGLDGVVAVDNKLTFAYDDTRSLPRMEARID